MGGFKATYVTRDTENTLKRASRSKNKCVARTRDLTIHDLNQRGMICVEEFWVNGAATEELRL